MADSGSRSTFSLSRFLPRETETALTEGDDEDEVNDYVSSVDDEEYLQFLLDRERDRDHILSHVDDWIKVARSEAIQWIINMRSYFRFRFHTAYLSVIYIDRFLSKGLISSDKHWAIRLLSVACLSLAAKMAELKAPALSDLPTEGYNFESGVIQRMELLVLTTLDWRMHSITPFNFINSFISCFGTESSNKQFVSLTTHIILATTKDMNFIGHRSSTIAMAATLMVIDQNLTKEYLEIKLKTTWLNRLFDHDDVYACYSRMVELEPIKVNVSKPDLATNLENRSVGTKRKRLAFSELEKK